MTGRMDPNCKCFKGILVRRTRIPIMPLIKTNRASHLKGVVIHRRDIKLSFNSKRTRRTENMILYKICSFPRFDDGWSAKLINSWKIYCIFYTWTCTENQMLWMHEARSQTNWILIIDTADNALQRTKYTRAYTNEENRSRAKTGRKGNRTVKCRQEEFK